MILEVAILDVIEELVNEFEENFEKAQKIISSMAGYKHHELQRCIEKQNRYILLVHWETIEDHVIGFRQSNEYQEWKQLLHKFYDSFPTVEHYQKVY